MLADAPDTGHLLLVEGSGVNSLEIFFHLRCGGWARDTDVHVRMGKNESVLSAAASRHSPSGMSLGLRSLRQQVAV